MDVSALAPTDSPQLKVITFSYAEIYFSFQNLVLNVSIFLLLLLKRP